MVFLERFFSSLPLMLFMTIISPDSLPAGPVGWTQGRGMTVVLTPRAPLPTPLHGTWLWKVDRWELGFYHPWLPLPRNVSLVDMKNNWWMALRSLDYKGMWRCIIMLLLSFPKIISVKRKVSNFQPSFRTGLWPHLPWMFHPFGCT